jgi:hypothetical protein
MTTSGVKPERTRLGVNGIDRILWGLVGFAVCYGIRQPAPQPAYASPPYGQPAGQGSPYCPQFCR